MTNMTEVKQIERAVRLHDDLAGLAQPPGNCGDLGQILDFVAWTCRGSQRGLTAQLGDGEYPRAVLLLNAMAWLKKVKPISRGLGDPGGGPHWCVAPILDVLPHGLYAIGNIDFWRPTELRTDLGNIRPGGIRFSGPFGNWYGRRRPQLPNDLVDADGLATTNVVHFTYAAAIGDRDQRIYGIAHEGEVACLLAVADDR